VCHDTDGRPPIPPIAGGALESGLVTLTSADGTAFAGYRARPATRTGDAVLILPDVRGLHPYYEDLALRFAEHGLEALAPRGSARRTAAGARSACSSSASASAAASRSCRRRSASTSRG
jgi:carboxymethylenebutenolidase